MEVLSADKDFFCTDNGTSAFARNWTSLSMIATFFNFIKIYSTFQIFNCCIMAEIFASTFQNTDQSINQSKNLEGRLC